MWSEAIPLSHDVEALLFDCEGLNARNSYSVDVKLFIMSLLISSQLVFNTVGHITDTTLEELSLLLLAENEIKVGDVDISTLMPNFTWVIRDVTMDFKHLTAQTYLNQCLDEQSTKKGVSETTQHKNGIRKAVHQFFGGNKEMQCYAFVEAMESSSFLGFGDSKKIRDEFKSEAEKLMLDLKQNHRVKEIDGKPMTGYMLLNLALEYIDALNNSQPI